MYLFFCTKLSVLLFCFAYPDMVKIIIDVEQWAKETGRWITNIKTVTGWFYISSIIHTVVPSYISSALNRYYQFVTKHIAYTVTCNQQ